MIKDGDALERLSKVKKIIFDKTGTLTYGKPEVTEIINCEKYDKNKLIQYVASLENKSEHPLGKAIVDFYNNYSNNKLLEVKNFKMEIGKGVKGKINQELILAGNEKIFEENNITLPQKYQEDTLKYIKKVL